MKIQFKLYATLQKFLPSTAVNNAVSLDVDDDVTLHQLIDQFNVARTDAHLVLVNGVYYDFESRDHKDILKDGDVVAVWPPVAGG